MELLDIYDNEGNVTGKKIIRGDKTIVLSENEHIAIAIIFIENNKGEYLIQKTSKEKGGKYSSTGGHVSSGETPLESIKREVEEELGINIRNDKIEELGFLLYDKPLRYIFYLKKNIDLIDINVQEDEVEFVKYMNIDEIKDLMDKSLMIESHCVAFKKVLQIKKNTNI